MHLYNFNRLVVFLLLPPLKYLSSFSLSHLYYFFIYF